MRSQNAYDQPLTLRDSQYFLFPLLLARRTRDVQAEALYTLSQLFIELNNPRISRRSVHLQIYTYSDIIGQAVRKSLGPLKMFARQLEERMVIVQGFLHSDESATMAMTLKRDGEKDFLQLDAQPNPESRRMVKKVLRELLGQTRRLGGIVVPPMLQLAEPGRSFHCGGSLPMRASPGTFESDRAGPSAWLVARPRGGRQRAAQCSRHDDHFFRHGQRAPHRLGNGGIGSGDAESPNF